MDFKVLVTALIVALKFKTDFKLLAKDISEIECTEWSRKSELKKQKILLFRMKTKE